MFMHMPKKLGIPVLLAVGLCVGAYCVYVAMPVRVGDWEIYQGTGRVVRDAEDCEEYADVSYTVRQPSRRLFRSRAFEKGPLPGDDNLTALTLEYQTEWPTALRVVVREKDGATYEAHVPFEHSDGWTTARMEAADFKAVGGASRPLDLRRIRGGVDFYDGSGVAKPSTRFSNRLLLKPLRASAEDVRFHLRHD